MLTTTQKTLVQESWTQVLPIADQAAALFYGRLFEVAPEFRPMFRGDMAEQGKKLMQMITVAVRSLDTLDQIIPAVKAMGARHGRYGVHPSHYAIVGDCLLWTLAQGLGPAFTDDVREAWTLTYSTLATVMQEGAQEPVAA